MLVYCNEHVMNCFYLQVQQIVFDKSEKVYVRGFGA